MRAQSEGLLCHSSYLFFLNTSCFLGLWITDTGPLSVVNTALFSHHHPVFEGDHYVLMASTPYSAVSSGLPTTPPDLCLRLMQGCGVTASLVR